MRCYTCNNALSDFESTLKGSLSNTYLDMCKKCIKGLGIATRGPQEELEEDEEETYGQLGFSMDSFYWEEEDDNL